MVTNGNLCSNGKTIAKGEEPQTRQPDNYFVCLDCIRVISMVWIHLGHVIVLYLPFIPLRDVENVYTKFKNSIPLQFISSATFAVDTFFAMSGLLTAYCVTRTLRRSSTLTGRVGCAIKVLMHRYVRLACLVPFIVILSVIPLPDTSLITPMIRSMVKKAMSGQYGGCSSYWGHVLLLISNVAPPEATPECVAWTWYLANDWQFSIFGVGLVLIYLWRKDIGWIISMISLLLSLVISIALCIRFDFPSLASSCSLMASGGLEDFVYDDRPSLLHMDDFPGLDFFIHFYIAPWVRVQAFLVGFMAGLWYLEHSARSYFWTHLPRFAARCIEGCLYMILIVIIIMPGFVKCNQPLYWGSVIFISLSRTIWCLAMVTLFLMHQNAALSNAVSSVLLRNEWKWFGRLSYSYYLVHPMVLCCYYSCIPLLPVSFHVMLLHFIVTLFLTLTIANVVTVYVENPIKSFGSVFVERVCGYHQRFKRLSKEAQKDS